MGWQDAPIVDQASQQPTQPAQDQPAWKSAPVVSTPEQHSTLEEIGRQIGLTLRAGATGIAALPAMAADALISAPINAGLDATLGKGHGFRFMKSEQALGGLLTSAGVPEPKNELERVVQDAASGAAGAGGFVGAGRLLSRAAGPVTAAVGDALASGPGLQAVSGATGTGAASEVREKGGTPEQQALAGLAGGLAPSGLQFAKAAGLRGMMRGGEEGRVRAADNLATFEAVGTSPTVGQVTDNRLMRATESMLAKAPGGAGVIAAKAQRQADDMQAAVQALSDSLAPGANTTSAGEAIVRGVGAFKDAFKTTQGRLYRQLDAYIPDTTRIEATNTQAALAELSADIPGAPALSKWFKNARIAGIDNALQSDTQGVDAVLTRPGMKGYVDEMRKGLEAQSADAAAANAERKSLGMTEMEPVLTPDQINERINGFLSTHVDNRLSYEAMRKLRTLVGNEIADSGLTSDVPRSKWVKLYGALSQDLGDAAKDAGPGAEQAWARANDYTRLHLQRLEQLSGIVGRDTPEKVFQAALTGTSEGATNVSRVMKALPTAERKEVAAAVLQRMGRATPGQQNADADAFSAETFLTNLSKMSGAARQAIFGAVSDKEILTKVQRIAQVAESRREGGRVFANPSGTAAGAAQLGVASGLGAGIATAAMGHPATLVGALAAPAGAYGAAKMLTSPAMARLAATKAQIEPGAPAAAVEAAGLAARERVAKKKREDAVADIFKSNSIEGAARAANRAVSTDIPQIPSSSFEITPSGAAIVMDSDGDAASILREAGIPWAPMSNGRLMIPTSRVPAARAALGLSIGQPPSSFQETQRRE